MHRPIHRTKKYSWICLWLRIYHLHIQGLQVLEGDALLPICGILAQSLHIGTGIVAARSFIGSFLAVHGVHVHGVIGTIMVDVGSTAVPG